MPKSAEGQLDEYARKLATELHAGLPIARKLIEIMSEQEVGTFARDLGAMLFMLALMARGSGLSEEAMLRQMANLFPVAFKMTEGVTPDRA